MTLSTGASKSIVKRTLLVIALLVTEAQAECISLANSTTCPSFADYSIDTAIVTKLVDYGINIGAFKTLAEFDSAAMNATGFKTSSDCIGYSSSTRIPYQNTLLCTIAISEPTSQDCKKILPGMCAKSCTLYQQGLQKMVNSTCPKATNSLDGLQELTGVCNHSNESWAALQDETSTCIDALKNEATTCGMGSSAGKCTFCQENRAALCCADVSTCNFPTTTTAASTTFVTAPSTTGTGGPQPTSSKSGLSSTALGGIIGGSVAFVVIAAAVCFFCMRRTRREDGGKGPHLARQISNSSGHYNISSPKIQEQGFSASSAPIPLTTLPVIIPESQQFFNFAGPAIVAAGTDTALAGARGSVGEGGKQSYCQALYPYQASMADELDLNPGDIVNVQKVFDDGWAVGVNMNSGSEGAFPVVCVMFVDESALDDDFEEVNMHGMSPMTLREEDQEGRLSPSGRNSPRSSLPSRSSSPVHLPRRNSSIRDSTGSLPGSSLMTSSPLAGERGGRLSPAPRDTVLSDASSINRRWDGEGKR
ncbi:hypothetical protein CPB97_007007 [Podila verticillata]|nr:hypothetical protein CPB97_007007 [Podila verticillata]